MATRVVVEPLPSVVVAGRAHIGFDVRAEGPVVSGSDHVLSFVIDRVPLYFTLTLIEAYMVESSAVDLWLGTEPPGGDPWDTSRR